MFQETMRTILLTSALVVSLLPASAMTAQQSGGELFYGEQPSIGEFNPYGQAANDGPTDRFLSLIYEPLFRWNYSREVLEPVLGLKATRTTPTSKAARSAFFVDLKPNVRWHDGTPFTAKDVEFTFAYIMSAVSENKTARSTTNELILSVKQVTPLRVLFEFKKDVPQAELFLNHLIIPISRFVTPSMLPIEADKELGDWAVGTGPYKQMGRPKRDPELVLNKEYHGTVGKLAAISSRVQNDNPTMVESFLNLSGELNLLVEVPERSLKRVEANRATVTTRPLTAYNVYAVAIRQNRGSPLVSGRARRAIAMAIDREQIRANWFMGRGRVLPGPFTPSSPFWDETLDPLPPDTAKAKAEFKALNMTARPFKLIYKSGDGGGETLDSDLAQTVVDALIGAGLQVTSTPKLQPDYLKMLYDDRTTEWDMAIVRMEFNPLYDITDTFRTQPPGAGGFNYMKFSNVEVDQKLDEAAAPDVDKVRKINLIKSVASILRDSVPAVFLVNQETVIAHKNRLVIPHGTLESFYFFPYANFWSMSTRAAR